MKKLIPILFILVTTNIALAEQSGTTPKDYNKKKGLTLPKEVSDQLLKMNINIQTVEGKRIEKADFNKDGKVDSEMTFLNGKLFSEKIDLNGDGKFDKSDWHFETGDIIQATTIDSNYDGKVDVKVIKTLKGAKKGHFLKVTYRDMDYDGKFDKKKTQEISGHQKISNGSEPGRDHCINCDVRAYQDMHLPAILDTTNRNQIVALAEVVTQPNIGSFLKNGKITFDLDIQRSCQSEGTAEDRELFSQTNILNSLKIGMQCLTHLANSKKDERGMPRTIYPRAGLNFRKAIGGLTGYSYNGGNFQSNGRSLSLVCKTPTNLSVSWTEMHGSNQKQAFAIATTSHRPELNNFRSFANSPNIVFRPGIARALDQHWSSEYAGQTRVDKFQELIFHEYLHTALGTSHDDGELDFAQACGDYCFNKPASRDPIGAQIKALSKRICEGEFGSAYEQEYQEVRDRIRLLKEEKMMSTYQNNQVLQ